MKASALKIPVSDPVLSFVFVFYELSAIISVTTHSHCWKFFQQYNGHIDQWKLGNPKIFPSLSISVSLIPA